MIDQSVSINNMLLVYKILQVKKPYEINNAFPDVKILKSKINTFQKIKYKIESKKYRIPVNADFYDKYDQLKSDQKACILNKLFEIAEKINGKNRPIRLKKVSLGRKISYFVLDPPTIERHFEFQLVVNNLKRLYKLSSESRSSIVNRVFQHLRMLNKSKSDIVILRLDIKKFYDSISQKILLNKLKSDNYLSYHSMKVIEKLLKSYNTITGLDCGVPKGINLSAYLSELYMKEFDNYVKSKNCLISYSRYVDDIMCIYYKEDDDDLEGKVIEFLENIGLEINSNGQKYTRLNCNNSIVKPQSFVYLGYEFIFSSKECTVDISENKLIKYKKRLDSALHHYRIEIKGSRKYRLLMLKLRLRYLMTNYRIRSKYRKKTYGIFNSNRHISDISKSRLRDVTDHLSCGLKKSRINQKYTQSSYPTVNDRFDSCYNWQNQKAVNCISYNNIKLIKKVWR